MNPDTAYTTMELFAQGAAYSAFVIAIAVFVDRLFELGEYFRRRKHLNSLKAEADHKRDKAYGRRP